MKLLLLTMLILSISANADIPLPECKFNINFRNYKADVKIIKEQRTTAQAGNKLISIKYQVIPIGLEDFDFDFFYYKNVTGESKYNYYIGEIRGDGPHEIVIVSNVDGHSAQLVKAETKTVYTRLLSADGEKLDITIHCDLEQNQ